MEQQAPAEKSGSELVDEFARLQQPNVYSPEACAAMAATIARIHELKRERNAVILAHNYQRPEIFEVADFVGDSLELARQGQHMSTPTSSCFCGVHFMAETAKILSPEKTVLLPDLRAGCSLADSVDPDELVERRDELRKLYPDLQVVAYVNTTAAVKAVVDVCCTSANAVQDRRDAADRAHPLRARRAPRRATCSARPTKTVITLERQLLRPPPDHAGEHPGGEGRRCRT